jgi:hypothetical protein
MAVIVIGQERVRGNPERVKRRQPLEHSYKHLFFGVPEWPVRSRSHGPVVTMVPREALAKPPSSVLQAPYSEARIQNWNPLTGNVFCYSDSCILYSDFSLANTPEGVLQEPHVS